MEEYQIRFNKKIKEKYGFSYPTVIKIGKENISELLKRDKKECKLCKTIKDLTIDHIDGQGRHFLEKGLPMNNNPSNLRILCRSCHGRISGKITVGTIKRKSPFKFHPSKVRGVRTCKVISQGYSPYFKGVASPSKPVGFAT